jgi:hypothetical protein
MISTENDDDPYPFFYYFPTLPSHKILQHVFMAATLCLLADLASTLETKNVSRSHIFATTPKLHPANHKKSRERVHEKF